MSDALTILCDQPLSGVPEWVHLVPFGKLHTRDKRRFVNDAPQTVLATFEMDGIDLPIDDQHRSDIPATQNGPVPAAGWIKEPARRADIPARNRPKWAFCATSLGWMRMYSAPPERKRAGRQTPVLVRAISCLVRAMLAPALRPRRGQSIKARKWTGLKGADGRASHPVARKPCMALRSKDRVTAGRISPRHACGAKHSARAGRSSMHRAIASRKDQTEMTVPAIRYPNASAQVAVYVEALGPELTVEFLLEFGGAEIYIPKNSYGRSEIAEMLGPDARTRLAANAHLLPRRVPHAKRWIAASLAARGMSINRIARRLHASTVSVRGLLRAAEKREAEGKPV